MTDRQATELYTQNILNRTYPIYQKLRDNALDMTKNTSMNDQLIVPIDPETNSGILQLKMKICPLGDIWNGYIILSSEAYHTLHDNNKNKNNNEYLDYLGYEDITYGPKKQEDDTFVIGFDTAHIYNKIPTDLHPIFYTIERLYAFMLYIIASIDNIKDFDYKLPKAFENNWH